MIAVLAIGVICFYRSFLLIQLKEKENVINSNKQEQAAEENLTDTMVINNIFGNITAISPDKKFLTVEATIAMGIDIPEEHKIKTVLIDDKTKFVLKQYKSQGQFDKELAGAKTQAKGSLFTPPDPFVEQKITVADLKVGDRINFVFTPKERESSINNNQFLATQINVGP